jgi:hypothetical protein
MSHEVIERYQVAGLDERERGFNRILDLEREGDRYRAVFRYETTTVTTAESRTTGEALNELIAMLRARGYRQLRSRLNFQGETYLGSREPWLEYPDPPPAEAAYSLAGWIRRIVNAFNLKREA